MTLRFCFLFHTTNERSTPDAILKVYPRLHIYYCSHNDKRQRQNDTNDKMTPILPKSMSDASIVYIGLPNPTSKFYQTSDIYWTSDKISDILVSFCLKRSPIHASTLTYYFFYAYSFFCLFFFPGKREEKVGKRGKIHNLCRGGQCVA